MELTYLLSQICVILAVLFLGSTYLIKNKKIILFLTIMMSIFYGLQYLFLNAITGVFMNIVSIIRSIWFYINAKNKKKNSIIVLIVLFIIIIILELLSFKNIFSLLPMIATMIFTYSLWQDNIKVYRWLAIPMSISWIIYNTYSNSIFGIITESILLIIEIIGIIKLRKK